MTYPPHQPPYPPQQPPPPWPPVGPSGWAPPPGSQFQPPKARKPWLPAIAAVVVVALLAVIAVLLFTRDDGTASEAQDPGSSTSTVSVADLSDLLLSPIEVAATVGSVTMISDDMSEELGGGTIEDQRCLGAVLAGQRDSYDGSGWTAARREHLESPSKDKKVTQAVVAFADATAAADYVEQAKDTWERCAGENINLRPVGVTDARNLYWSLGEVSDTDDILTSTQVQEGGGGWQCVRTLAARNNIVIDADLCGNNISASVGPSLVEEINENIEAAL